MRKLLVVSICMLALVRLSHADSTPHWVEVRSPHFQVVTDSNEKQARKIAGQFERMRSLFRTVLPNAGGDAGLPITVLALRDKKGFQALEPAAYLAKGQISLAGLFLTTQDRNYILLRLDAEGEHPYAVVYHEYTHFILRKAEWLPLWLNEGLAEFYQNTDIEDKDVKLGQPSTDDILYLRQNRLLPLPTLFAVDYKSPYYHDEQKGSVFYAESWALTHFIEINDYKNKTNRLQDYVKLLANHGDPVASAQKAFGDLGQLQKALDNYVSQSSYQLFQLNMAFTADEASFQAKPLPTPDADAIRASVLAHDNRQTEAKALVDAVLHQDPKNAIAYETLGAMAYEDHDLAGAKKWYGEAVQLDSQSFFAKYNYAVMSMMDNDRDKDDVIESSLQACIKQEPSFAPAYDALAGFYSNRNEKLNEAHILNLHAEQLDPGQLSYRLNAAQVLVQLKDFNAALNVLHTAESQLAKTTADTAQIQMRIGQIEQYRDALAQNEAASHVSVPSGGVTTSSSDHVVHVLRVAPAEEERKLPVPAASAPHRTVNGIVHDVKCSYPTALTFSISMPGKVVALFTPNYFKVNFTLTFPQTHDLDPCKSLEGMKARVQYAEVTDETLAGQALDIELSR